MTRIYLQQMVEDIPDDRLPEAWVDHDLAFFSHTKRLYDYQQQALRNALKALWKYYEGAESSLTPSLSPLGKGGEGEGSGEIYKTRQRKQQLWEWYKNNGLTEEDFSLEPKSTFAGLLREYYADYIDARTGKIAYEAFINRMGFWMATGSGKTLVIVKLIELLGHLRRLSEVPPCDILFLAPRDDLIEQLRRHVHEFNASHSDTPIMLYELKEYAAVKRERRSLFQHNEIAVFYYRSDNLSDEQKEKIVDFRNYDNDGQWFVLLDEAHKGDREESKRQHIYSILSRNGFLFNFSATFTDPLDIATTVYNLNLSEYIRKGYGKHLLVLQQELRAFKNKEDYNEEEKRKLVLKTLILLAYVRKVHESIKSPLTPSFSPLTKGGEGAGSGGIDLSLASGGEGGGRVQSPFTPSLSPFTKGGEGAGSGGIDLSLASGGEGGGRVQSPFTPSLSPLTKGGEGAGSGGILYHRPLMLVLVDSVNTEVADLELFFRELEQIASRGVDEALWDTAKNELWQELGQEPNFLFEEEKVKVDPSIWNSLSPDNLCRYVFNGDSWGEIEVLVHPSNRQEMAFKLKTTDRPFALIKIGDNSTWLKEKLSGHEIAERFDDKSLFARLNADDSDINILMGSRAFYEGWDSNRPNVICYINIGTGVEAQKFILQSVGRGVRIEPFPNKRRRLLPLYNAREVSPQEYQRLRDVVQPLETLFIFGTNRKALQTVLENLNKERTMENWQVLEGFTINPEAKKVCLLIPVYKTASGLLVHQKPISKFEIAQEELEVLRKFVQDTDDRVLLALTDAEPKQVKALRDALKQNSLFATNGRRYGDLRRLLRRVVGYFNVPLEEVEGLKALEDEIRHFKHISVSLKDIGELEGQVKRVKDYPTKVKKVRELYGKVSSEEYDQLSREISQVEEFTCNGKRITIKHIAQHYYLPVVLSEDGKADYIRHIIKTPSEAKFIKDLEQYLAKQENKFKEFDWWFFSKLDETLDEVYIPYYDPVTNRMARFKPDFIFWFSKEDRYWIVFVDPKGTEHTASLRKIDGYRSIFESENKPQYLEYSADSQTESQEANGCSDNGEESRRTKRVKVHLFFYGKRSNVPKEYQDYWIDSIDELLDRLLKL
jgi:superfamily II DNA or RNA helicase